MAQASTPQPEQITLVKTLDPEGSPLFRVLAEGETPAGESITGTVTGFVGQFRQVTLDDGSIVLIDTTHSPDTPQPPPKARRPF